MCVCVCCVLYVVCVCVFVCVCVCVCVLVVVCADVMILERIALNTEYLYEFEWEAFHVCVRE